MMLRNWCLFEFLLFCGLVVVSEGAVILTPTSSPTTTEMPRNETGTFSKANTTLKAIIKGHISRQDDDDPDVPYYVPAIAKVIGSVLAQNATSAIEESFGFIPPEVNKNIQYVISLIGETVEKLRPPTPTSTSTTPTPTGESAPNTLQEDAAAVAEIEALLAFALAQHIGASLAANTTGANAGDQTVPITEIPVVATTAERILSVSPALPMEATHGITIPEHDTSTLKYSYGTSQSIQSIISNVVDESKGLAVYAPLHAPNYIFTTTTEGIPVYASAFDHAEFPAVPPTPPRPAALPVSERPHTTEKVATATEDTETTTISTTTEDDDDEYDDDDERKRDRNHV